MSNDSQRTKRIFISDIHMGDDRSLHPGGDYHPYVWLKPPRTDMLRTFLEEKVLGSGDVKDLVILGDLFDTWVCPTEFDPPDFSAVAEAQQNAGIMDRLRQIAQHGDITLTIVPGNHDMMITYAAKAGFFEKYLPGAKFIGCDTPECDVPGCGVFKADGDLAAEHGSMYTLFCSPDNWSDERSLLPLGYFISRSAAHKNAVLGDGPDTLDIIAHFAREYLGDPEFSKAVYYAISIDSGLNMQDEIKMNLRNSYRNSDIDTYSITVEQVGERYPTLLKDWKALCGISTKPGYALINETIGLDGVAQSNYFLANKARIVILGHTHNAILSGYLKRNNYCELSLIPGQPCDCIYANSGTWINARKHCTYVETELNQERRKHYVSLYRYTDRGKSVRISRRYIRI